MNGPTDAEVEEFVEKGYLLLRGCIDPEVARSLARDTLEHRDPPPMLGRDESSLRPASGVDFHDPSTWGGAGRLEVWTGRCIPIAELSPRLWATVRALVGRATPTRSTMGEQWLVKGKLEGVPEIEGGPELTPDYVDDFIWHLDAPSRSCTLENRRDALTLLILWSDVAPGGGGTLYSGQTLDHVVHLLEAHPGGFDTVQKTWPVSFVARCTDVRELVGQAGDVLITHALALHAAHPCYRRTLRVLENPTITVAEPLRYYSDVEDPSPVERAVIRRLRQPRFRPREASDRLARALLAQHPDYFLPGRRAFLARVDAKARGAIATVDVALTRAWIAGLTTRARSGGEDAPSLARSMAAEVRELLVNDRTVDVPVVETVDAPDFAGSSFSRLLCGIVGTAAQNHILGLALSTVAPEVRVFAPRGTPHRLVWVGTPRGWFFVDAATSPRVFHMPGLFDAPHPDTPAFAPEPPDPRRARGALLSEQALREGALGARLFLPVGDDGATALPPGSSSAAQVPASFQAYLRVRLGHVLGGTAPRRAYAELLERHALQGTTLRVVEALDRRQRRAEAP